MQMPSWTFGKGSDAKNAHQKPEKLSIIERQTDEPTNRRTDKACYQMQMAYTRLTLSRLYKRMATSGQTCTSRLLPIASIESMGEKLAQEAK